MNENCEFFYYETAGYAFVILHNSTICGFEDEDDEWILQTIEGIDIYEVDYWVD